MNSFTWTVDHLAQPGFSAALLSMSDMAALPAQVYAMGKVPVTETVANAYTDGRSRGHNALGVAESWKREDVVAARLTRDGVRCTVNGKSTESKSLRESFRIHGLPDAKHIKFRMKLKAVGALTFTWDGNEYHFRLVMCADDSPEALIIRSAT